MSKPDATWKIPKTQFEEWATSDSLCVNFGENDCTEFQKFHRVELPAVHRSERSALDVVAGRAMRGHQLS
jgi:hypothetical protein